MSQSIEITPFAVGRFPVLPDGVYSVALGNGTRFTIAILRAKGPLCDSHPACVLGKVHVPSGIFVAVECWGAYHFSYGYDPGYVASKLGLREYMGDAANIADFLDCQLGVVRNKPFGTYHSNVPDEAEPPAWPSEHEVLGEPRLMAEVRKRLRGKLPAGQSVYLVTGAIDPTTLPEGVTIVDQREETLSAAMTKDDINTWAENFRGTLTSPAVRIKEIPHDA